MKHCPECQSVLEIKKYKIFHTWICPEGHGTLYPAGELEHIICELSGLNEALDIWSDQDHFSVIESLLVSPDGARQLLEIRDTRHMNIMIYGDPETKSLWMHVGEEEKLLTLIEQECNSDSLGSYLALAADEAIKIFEDEQTLSVHAGHFLVALKLLGTRIATSFPNITL
jgi:Zn-finger nucleic acid-binding protein